MVGEKLSRKKNKKDVNINNRARWVVEKYRWFYFFLRGREATRSTWNIPLGHSLDKFIKSAQIY